MVADCLASLPDHPASLAAYDVGQLCRLTQQAPRGGALRIFMERYCNARTLEGDVWRRDRPPPAATLPTDSPPGDADDAFESLLPASYEVLQSYIEYTEEPEAGATDASNPGGGAGGHAATLGAETEGSDSDSDLSDTSTVDASDTANTTLPGDVGAADTVIPIVPVVPTARNPLVDHAPHALAPIDEEDEEEEP